MTEIVAKIDFKVNSILPIFLPDRLEGLGIKEWLLWLPAIVVKRIEKFQSVWVGNV